MKNLQCKTYDTPAAHKANEPMSLPTSELIAYERLTTALIGKKLVGVNWVKSITYRNQYTNKQITVKYDNGVIDVFTYD